MSECPYCHNTEKFDSPKPLVDEKSAKILESMGIETPAIQNCLVCHATLSPKSFTRGSDEYNSAVEEYAACH